ncbi:14109_t:CDS:2 [Gigaspora margarita]|uniref:14109_t:CDS:1 n=1 Tax=Gigaspora margarita TaxID=4874 RepID=A0ABN7UK30_GIGMA|nr:14109_t:CDS:2 [Gigaspora margarita]
MNAGLTRDIRVTDPLDNHDKQQLKKAWSESAKEKKARWFVEIER